MNAAARALLAEVLAFARRNPWRLTAVALVCVLWLAAVLFAY